MDLGEVAPTLGLGRVDLLGWGCGVLFEDHAGQSQESPEWLCVVLLLRASGQNGPAAVKGRRPRRWTWTLPGASAALGGLCGLVLSCCVLSKTVFALFCLRFLNLKNSQWENIFHLSAGSLPRWLPWDLHRSEARSPGLVLSGSCECRGPST